MLAAVITARNSKEAIIDTKKAQNADLIELRLDYIQDIGKKNFLVNERARASSRMSQKNFFTDLIKNCKKPVIITNRKKEEGGFFSGSESERVEVLKNGIKSNTDYVDIESSSNKKLIKGIMNNKKNAKMIISYHNLKETPENIKNIYCNIKKLNPDLIKIVTNANSVVDNFKIFNLIESANKEKKKIIAFCMGSYGQFSRILSIILGSRITYASISKRKESAIGQLTINEMANIYRIKKLNKKTKIAGLIGNPVEHSWSHIIHNAAFNKLGINAVYLKFQVDKSKEFIDYFKKLEIIGFSVTIPHKIEIIKYLDEIDKKAEAIGAVNTIVVKNKKLIGYNTDCGGAIKALKAKTELKNKKVTIIGAGGSTRAIAYGLKEEGAGNITILNRTIEKARLIAEDFDCSYGSLNDLKNIDYDILVNTTPVGMYPNVNSSPIPSNLIKKNTIVFDIVFNPYKTKLLKTAEKKGCIVIPGFEMLINGAVMQFKLWTGRDAPEQVMRSKCKEFI